MEELIGYIWKNRLLSPNGLKTTSGESLEIIDTGEEENKNLFVNAKLRIGEEFWSGNIVIHSNSSDWESELMTGNSRYDNVILHITMNDDIETLRRAGEAIHQLRINCSESLSKEFKEMLSEHLSHPCEKVAIEQKTINLHSYLSRLLIERIEEKAEKIEQLFRACEKRWDDTLFKLLIRSYGFGIQNDAFEEWASLLNMPALNKHRNNIEQVEAIFFGQAGLLNEGSIPPYYVNDAVKSDYYKTLVREYKFLKGKFSLKEMDFRRWRAYGNYSPHIRIARLAALYQRNRIGIGSITHCETEKELCEILQIQPSSYWQHHTQFGSTTTSGAGDVSKKQLDILIINAVVPIMYCYGKHRRDIILCNKAEDYLHTLRSEDNSIVRKWMQQGVVINCAADSQALIQLNKAYCTKQRCSSCLFARSYFKTQLAAC